MTRARAVIPLVLAALAVAVAPAQAADVIVNTTADSPSSTSPCTPEPGGCTLREAIEAAGPTDVVRVPAGTYGLTQGPLLPNGDTIVGAGARTTIIDGTNTSKVLYVTTAGNQVSGVTITRGNGLAVQAPAVGGAILVNSTFAPAGLTLTNSTVSASNAPAGGGIGSNGTLTLVGSTVSGNTVFTNGSDAVGGGIAVIGGTTTLRNSTVSGNVVGSDELTTQGGGVYVAPAATGAAGTLVTQSVTIARNQADAGGGLYRAPSTAATISHTIIADNPVGGACGGAVTPLTADHNIADDATCTFAGSPREPLLGLLVNNGGPTNTHALTAASPAVNTGTSCPATDQRGVARQGACDIGAFEYVPSPPPPGDPGLPPPVVGRLINAEPESGTVRIKLPGRKRFRTLTEGEQLPVGTTIDTRKGRIALTAAANKTGGTASADFYKGLFRLTQTKGRRPITTLTLVEKLACKTGNATAAAKRKKKRRLWGDGKGRFRTKGKHSAATVLGTKWLVEDRCTSTLTRVVRGKVSVRDFVERKTKTVRRGKRYIARAKR